MKTSIFFLLLFTIAVSTAVAQQSNFHFPQKQVNYFNNAAYKKICARDTAIMRTSGNTAPASGVLQALKLQHSLNIPAIFSSLKTKRVSAVDTVLAHDTLIVNDTVLITGTYTHNGPIIILNGGWLRFKHATATIIGDIYVVGANSRLDADSSYLYIPQQYFYQRSLVVVQGGIVHYNNTTLDHSGLSNNLLEGNNSFVEMTNVTNNGFTTNSIYGNAQIIINGTNQAGEYVINDYAQLSFRKANTVLLWHQFPDTAVINFSFPNGDTLASYIFNNSLTGVKGVEYSIIVDTCTNVMWGMMPATGSHVSISNSNIRSIGLWFTGHDTIAVNGLVDNSTYTAFTASLSDRYLQLTNCDVQTWSIYPMDSTHVNLSGCIVGEVGTEQHSSFMGSNFTCDGSGGYMWATDTSFVLAGYCSAENAVRSQGNGILLFAYSSLMGGYPSALNNSVIMVIQSSVLQEPTPLDNSCAWYALIDEPFNTYVDTTAAVTGSAWIVKTATSMLMNFHSYRLYYQPNLATSWNDIITDSLNAKHADTLGMWNTHGLAAGQYNLKLVLRDNWNNTAEAVKAVNVMPKILVGIKEQTIQTINCFPNPATDNLTIKIEDFRFKNLELKIDDVVGNTVLETTIVNNKTIIDVSALAKGVYFIKIKTDKGVESRKFIKE